MYTVQYFNGIQVVVRCLTWSAHTYFVPMNKSKEASNVMSSLLIMFHSFTITGTCPSLLSVFPLSLFAAGSVLPVFAGEWKS